MLPACLSAGGWMGGGGGRVGNWGNFIKPAVYSLYPLSPCSPRVVSLLVAMDGWGDVNAASKCEPPFLLRAAQIGEIGEGSQDGTKHYTATTAQMMIPRSTPAPN